MAGHLNNTLALRPESAWEGIGSHAEHHGMSVLVSYSRAISQSDSHLCGPQVLCGLLLSIVFVQSHNGMEVYSGSKDFVTAQVSCCEHASRACGALHSAVCPQSGRGRFHSNSYFSVMASRSIQTACAGCRAGAYALLTGVGPQCRWCPRATSCQHRGQTGSQARTLHLV